MVKRISLNVTEQDYLEISDYVLTSTGKNRQIGTMVLKAVKEYMKNHPTSTNDRRRTEKETSEKKGKHQEQNTSRAKSNKNIH